MPGFFCGSVFLEVRPILGRARQGGNPSFAKGYGGQAALAPLYESDCPDDVGDGAGKCDNQENNEDLDGEFNLWAGHGEGFVGPAETLSKKNGSGGCWDVKELFGVDVGASFDEQPLTVDIEAEGGEMIHDPFLRADHGE